MNRGELLIRFLVSGLLLLPAGSSAADQTSPARTKESVTRDLDEVARVASVMVDGDLCRRIMLQRSTDRIFNPDPNDPWSAGDDFNVNHEAYIQAKKTLMRLARLVDYPCDVNLWMPFDGHPEKVQVLIRNVYEMSRFWIWGALTQDMFPEMRKVLDTGERQTVSRRAGMISVLAPVFNSLGDVVGVLEVVAQDPAAPPIPVHALWNAPARSRPSCCPRRRRTSCGSSRAEMCGSRSGCSIRAARP